jgi:hypothetical protein
LNSFSHYGPGLRQAAARAVVSLRDTAQIVIVPQTGQLFENALKRYQDMAVFEAFRIEPIVGLNIIENFSAILKPYRRVVAVAVFVASGAHSRGKVMEERDQRLGFDETGRVRIPDFFDRPEALAHRAGLLNWCCLFVLGLSFSVGRPSEG